MKLVWFFDRLVRLVYKKKNVDDAINLKKVMNEEFLTHQSNQFEEYRIDLGAAMNDAVKKLNIAPKKKRFRESCKQLFSGGNISKASITPSN